MKRVALITSDGIVGNVIAADWSADPRNLATMLGYQEGVEVDYDSPGGYPSPGWTYLDGMFAPPPQPEETEAEGDTADAEAP